MSSVSSKEQVLAGLPKLEEHCNRRATSLYKICHPSAQEDTCNKGIYAVATQDIEKDEVILVEKALYVQPNQNHPSLFKSTEFNALMAQLSEFGKTHGHLSGPDRYPPKAREALDRLTELNATAYAEDSDYSTIKEVWNLEDSHRKPLRGDKVKIEGLTSDKGKPLNGRFGRVLGQDNDDAERLKVKLTCNNEVVKKSIKPCNLKTLGGILRTNSYECNDEPTSVLFKDLCRMNHACGDAANVNRMIFQRKAYAIAAKDIQKGQELLVDYMPGEEGDRLGLLHVKYNFWCQCPNCQPK